MAVTLRSNLYVGHVNIFLTLTMYAYSTVVLSSVVIILGVPQGSTLFIYIYIYDLGLSHWHGFNITSLIARVAVQP